MSNKPSRLKEVNPANLNFLYGQTILITKPIVAISVTSRERISFGKGTIFLYEGYSDMRDQILVSLSDTYQGFWVDLDAFTEETTKLSSVLSL